MFSTLSLSLVSTVELSPFEDDVSSDFEEPVQLGYDSFIVFSLSLSVMLVEVSTSSASSPMQYSSVLTVLALSPRSSPVALRYWLKRRFHFGHSSGHLKSNRPGGLRDRLVATAVAPSAPLRAGWVVSSSSMSKQRCHHVVCGLFLRGPEPGASYHHREPREPFKSLSDSSTGNRK